MTQTLTEPGKAPPLTKLSEIHLGSRNLRESELFLVDALGGVVTERGRNLRVRFTNLDFVMEPEAGRGVLPGAEYPHYAFTVDEVQFAGIKHRLDAFAIKTNEPWTRKGDPTKLLAPGHALMYFRDPSGNQYELFSPTGCTLLPLRVGSRAGGDYVIDFPALQYDRIVPPAGDAPPLCPPAGWNHTTMPVKDLAEATRFLVHVFGGKVILDLPSHVTAVFGGAEMGVAPQKGGWTGPDTRLPHYTFDCEPAYLAQWQERLTAFGVPTSGILSSNGTDAYLYFRDPSGNMYQLLCKQGFTGRARRAQPHEVDAKALNYTTWRDPHAAGPASD